MPLQSFQRFFINLRRRAKDNVNEDEGLVWIYVWPLDDTRAEDFDHIVDNLLVPRLLALEGVSLLWNVQNTRPGARGGSLRNGGPRALLTKYDDLGAAMASATLNRLSNNEGRPSSSKSGRTVNRIFATEMRTYQAVQRHAGQHGSQVKGTSLVAVWIEPAEGQDEEIEDWYREEHLAMIAAQPIFLRSTRYKLSPHLIRGANEDAPRFLTIHECKSTQALLDHATDHGMIVPETPWSKQIFAAVKSVERQIWEINGRHVCTDGNLGKKLQSL